MTRAAKVPYLKIVLVVLAAAVLGHIGFRQWWIWKQDQLHYDASRAGAHMYDEAASYPGYNLYGGKLYDAQGKVVKEWSSTELGVLDVNGDYYAQHHLNAAQWGRYTWDDQVVWERRFQVHHEICLTPQGTVITFIKEVHPYHGKKHVEFDVILELDKKDGRVIDRYSIWEHIEEFKKYHRTLAMDNQDPPRDPGIRVSILRNNANGIYDFYHLNSLSIVPETPLKGTHPAFEPGNWIISFRHGSMIFILDRKTKKILWRAVHKQVKGNLEGQHTPVMLSNGNLLIFDNGRYRRWSRVIELDPRTLDIVWEYRDRKLYSETQGQAQKLPNGNVLITDTENGRALEVTPDKKIVWEYYTRGIPYPEKFTQKVRDNSISLEYLHRDTRNGGVRLLVRHEPIYRMTRYPKEMIDRLLDRPKSTEQTEKASA